jgi:hypothetical protein
MRDIELESLSSDAYLLSLEDKARQIDLSLPRVEVADGLQKRFARSGETIVLNPDNLFYGTRDAAIENQVQVRINVKAKDDNSRSPDISYPEPVSELRSSSVAIKDGTKESRTREEDANTALWLGALVVDEIAQGGYFNKHHYFSTKSGKLVGGVVFIASGLQVSETAGLIYMAPYVAWPFSAASVATASYVAYKLGVFGKSTFNKREESAVLNRIENKKPSQAKDLAEQYPVLSYQPLQQS